MQKEDSSSSGALSSFSVDTSDDADLDLEDITRPSSSMSVTSSVYRFVEEFGRTFHGYKQGKYFLPNDEVDLQHAIAKQLFGKLALAPIDQPRQVLDIGTGTGIWAVEFAEENPKSNVLGTDLSPIQPDYVPANCRFEIDDVEDEWAFGQPFDYIHGRYLSPFLRDIPKVLASVFGGLAPGGWAEFQEIAIDLRGVDGSLKGTAARRWNDLLQEGVRRLGRDALAALRYRAWMTDAGFVNVVERRFAVPMSPWAKGRDNKVLGAMQMTNHLEGIEGITLSVFTKGLGWTADQVSEFLVDVKKDLVDRRLHGYVPIIVIYGQKPPAPEAKS
ncbi:hypothetical protein VTK73DRAFT_9529 [Phialemonium thermophilum]|uniref:Methyltransferase domain-containing protein n=1 Tax=Phialemonium thermophilum TaxID=223376 RepID=A0ABR3XKS1_9PEZI